MKKLIFVLRGFYYFKLRKQGDDYAIVVNEFDDEAIYNSVLSWYRLKKSEGKVVYVLCAFNNAPLAVQLDDYRDIFIFENDANKMMDFCIKKGISNFYYYDNCVLRNFFKKLGVFEMSIIAQ